MVEGPTGDYGYAIKELLEYLRDKGQIWSAAQIASIRLVSRYVKDRYGVALPGLDQLVDEWIHLSVIEAARFETVAQRNAEKVARLSSQINYVEQQESHTKIVPFTRKKNK